MVDARERASRVLGGEQGRLLHWGGAGGCCRLAHVSGRGRARTPAVLEAGGRGPRAGRGRARTPAVLEAGDRGPRGGWGR